jgi:hypothetical protein
LKYLIKYVFLRTIKNKIKETFAYYKMKCGIWLRLFNCLNQDLQDLRIFRIVICGLFVMVEIIQLSESGFSGFEDLQDCYLWGVCDG